MLFSSFKDSWRLLHQKVIKVTNYVAEDPEQDPDEFLPQNFYIFLFNNTVQLMYSTVHVSQLCWNLIPQNREINFFFIETC
jgi:hypothetical protein